MLKKCAKVFKGEYEEWSKDEGPMHPFTVDVADDDPKFTAIRVEKTMVDPSRGMRLA